MSNERRNRKTDANTELILDRLEQFEKRMDEQLRNVVKVSDDHEHRIRQQEVAVIVMQTEQAKSTQNGDRMQFLYTSLVGLAQAALTLVHRGGP